MSASEAVDLHEKTKNFLTEAEVDRFLQAAKSGRHGIRDHLMMLLMYRHGLRETELCRLAVSALDMETARIWIDRLKRSVLRWYRRLARKRRPIHRLETRTDDSCNRDSMNLQFGRITIDPEPMNGQHCIRGMRLSVRRVVEAVAPISESAELKRDYPAPEDDSNRQALQLAAGNHDDQIIVPGAA